jgi:bifunctional oligoribonuclease and PAP phosphatase NrnA
MLRQVLEEIGRRDRFLLTSHARPDGDAVGSVLACWQILRSMGKHAQVVMSDPVPAIYRLLPFSECVVHATHVNNGFEAAIILECDSIQRTHLQGLDDRFLINIDHHSSARPFAHVNWIDPHACATAEMVYRLARQAGVPISPEIATCLYTAVLTDTGAFSFIGTNENTFALARELVLCGADAPRIAQSVYFSHPTSKMRLLGCSLSHLHREGKVSWMWITREQMDHVEAHDEDCEGLVNYALAIEGVEVAIFFRELADRGYRVSLRSKGAVNVAMVAEHFGGGGHQCASGCAIDGPLSIAVARIMAQLKLRPAVNT